jgi:hypothetical protein
MTKFFSTKIAKALNVFLGCCRQNFVSRQKRRVETGKLAIADLADR